MLLHACFAGRVVGRARKHTKNASTYARMRRCKYRTGARFVRRRLSRRHNNENDNDDGDMYQINRAPSCDRVEFASAQSRARKHRVLIRHYKPDARPHTNTSDIIRFTRYVVRMVRICHVVSAISGRLGRCPQTSTTTTSSTPVRRHWIVVATVSHTRARTPETDTAAESVRPTKPRGGQPLQK